MKRAGLYLIALAGCAMAASTVTAEETMHVQPGLKVLFLDDHAVASSTGLERTMHQPEKKGAVLRPDRPSDGIRLQTASAPTWDPDERVYKLFHMAFPYKDGNWVTNQITPAIAISKDGLHWDKPELGEIEIGGSKANNRFRAPGPDQSWPGNALTNIIYDPREQNPDRRYKGLLGAINRQPVASPDGINWELLDAEKIPSSDTSSLVYDELGQRYLATVKTGSKYGRSAAVSFSKDFVHWTEPVMTFHTDDEDQAIAKRRIQARLDDPGLQNPMFNNPDPDSGWEPPPGEPNIPTWRAETYMFPVFPYEGVYIGLPMIYYPTGLALPEKNNTVGFHEIQLAFSRDPELRFENWIRLGNREPFIATSRLDAGLVGNFDRQQIVPLSRPLVMDDELWFYYVGLKGRTPPYKMWPDGTIRNQHDLTPDERADFEDGWAAICLAVLRLDGFVSLDADESGGELTTKPFIATGSKLCLNVDVLVGGTARVAVLDANGDAITGFGLDDCVALTGNNVRQKVTWQTGASWDQLHGQTVQLRIQVKNARLYAFWTEPGPQAT